MCNANYWTDGGILYQNVSELTLLPMLFCVMESRLDKAKNFDRNNDVDEINSYRAAEIILYMYKSGNCTPVHNSA